VAQTGDVVEKDAPLAVLASPEYGEAQSDARRAMLDLALAEQTLKRLREILLVGAVPEKELRAAEIEYTRAEAEAKRKTERILLYGGNTNGADQEFSLRSPLAGTVVEKNINPGQEVRPDQMTANAPPLFVITDPARLWVLLDATEQDLTAIKRGAEIKVFSQTYPGQVFSARIDTVSDFVDPASRTIKVRASVDNSQHLLKAEMFVSAELPAAAQAGVNVPASSVFLKGNKHFVFVERAQGSYGLCEVTIGAERAGTIVVSSGLGAGEKVVVDGGLLLNQILEENSSEPGQTELALTHD
jgi:cobalt-zinc-cadmium efflux system membrane fusion protein